MGFLRKSKVLFSFQQNAHVCVVYVDPLFVPEWENFNCPWPKKRTETDFIHSEMYKLRDSQMSAWPYIKMCSSSEREE